jgi:membrane-bound lytic murein transglycosylase D
MFEDWDLALAAYNWGEGKVQRLIKSTGLSDFWQLADLRRKLPQETKNHVPLIQASVILAKNPEKYGLPVQLDPPLEYVKVSVSKPIDLRAAAKVLSLPIDELKKLNPALRGFTTPANYPNFQLKVPAGVDSSVHDQLAALPRAKSTPVQTSGSRHKVRPGETLSGIAARYRVSIAAIEKANNISAKKKLIAGKSLIIPAATAKAQTAKQTAGSSKATKAAAGKSGGQKGTGNAAEKSRISPSQSAKPVAKTAASDKGRARETASKQAVSR